MSVITSSVSDVVALTASGGDDIAAFEALLVAGRTVHLPSPLYKLSRELHVNVSDFHIIGTGHETTEIRRITNAGDAVIRWGAPDTATIPLPTWPCIGGGLERVKLQANNLADYGLHQKVHYRGKFVALTISAPVLAGLKTTTLVNTVADSAHFNYNEVTDCEYWDLRVNVSGADSTAYGLDLGGSTSDIGGQSTYHCRFYGLRVSHAVGAVGIYLRDVDDIFFYGWAVDGAHGGTAIEFQGGASTQGIGRNCTFVGGGGLTSSQVIIARDGPNYPSRDNLFLGLSTEDTVAPSITIEKGAGVRAVWNDGLHSLSKKAETFSEVEDEFVGANATSGSIGAWGWTTFGAGSAAYGATEAQHPGVFSVTSSGSGLCGMYGSPAGIGTLHLNSANFDLLSIVKAVSGSDSTSTYRVGWGNDPTVDPPQDGIWFEKLAADTQWFGVTSLGGTKSRSAIVNVTVSWVRQRIVRRATGTTGFVTGSLLSNQNLNAILFNLAGAWPTDPVSPFIQVRNSASIARTFSIDYMRQTITGMTR